MKLARTIFSVAAIFSFAVTVGAQARKPAPPVEHQQYFVSAKAGVVNVAEGEVVYMRGAGDWDFLEARKELLPMDRVKTGADGRAEILLNPGAYLRIAGDTEYVFTNTEVGGLDIDLLRGTAIIEASVVAGLITVTTPKGDFSITKAGLYRFQVAADGDVGAVVRKGQVIKDAAKVKIAGSKYITGGGLTVNAKQRVTVETGEPVVAKLPKDDALDEFDDWSRSRAKAIVASNKRLSLTQLQRNHPISTLNNVWVYDRFFNSYTFLPGYFNLSSPYGGRYVVCFYNGWSPYCCGPSYNGGNGTWGGGYGRPGSSTGGGTSSRPGGGNGGGSPGAGGGRGRIERPSIDGEMVRPAPKRPPGQ